MDNCDHCESRRPVAALIVLMALVFSTYFGMRFAMPELPLHAYQALMLLR